MRWSHMFPVLSLIWICGSVGCASFPVWPAASRHKASPAVEKLARQRQADTNPRGQNPDSHDVQTRPRFPAQTSTKRAPLNPPSDGTKLPLKQRSLETALPSSLDESKSAPKEMNDGTPPERIDQPAVVERTTLSDPKFKPILPVLDPQQDVTVAPPMHEELSPIAKQTPDTETPNTSAPSIATASTSTPQETWSAPLLSQIWQPAELIRQGFILGTLLLIFVGVVYASVKRMPILSLPKPRSELLRKNWVEMRGVEFELFLKEVFESRGDKVELTRTTGDFGVDLIVSHSGQRIAIQVKGTKSKVGVDAIQEAFTGMAYYQCTSCIVITNSDFTRQAKELSARTHCRLINRAGVVDLIRGKVLAI